MTVALTASPEGFDVAMPPDPYPGLRPFEKSEWPIFFGRERMIDETVARLIGRQFIFVHGDSGCGKSSLIKAGVLARLEHDNARGGVSWRTGEMQPRQAPMDTLAATLAGLDGRGGDRARVVEIRRALNGGAQAPRRVAELIRRGDLDQVCLLVDQFEELFAFARRGGRDEAILFAQFLVGLAKDPPPGLYAAVTMRSEFLGACAQYPGLAEAVNEVQYLVPRMAPLDLVRAIRKPAAAYNGHVSKDLAQRLIADAGGTQDQLPMIEHGLLALYRRKVPAEMRASPAPWRLELGDYTSTSMTLAELLSKHADDVADRAEPAGGRIVQTVFRAITEINAEGQAIRRPQTVGELLRLTNAGEQPLRDALKVFREEGASFLRPYGDGPLAGNDLIDISHEALIRSWRRIADPKDGWLVREFQDGLIWKSLLVQAEIFEREKSNVLSPTTASERRRWLGLHNAAWAERYGGGWERATRLVQGSVDAAEKEALRARIASRKFFILAVVVTVLSVGFLMYYLAQNRKVTETLRQAYVQSATSLWNRLDFFSNRSSDDELNALWEISVGNPEVREAFIAELSTDGERVGRFGRRPGSVARAVGVRWPAGRAASAFTFAISQAATIDPGQLTRLGLAANTLADLLTPAEAAAALPAAMRALESEKDPNRAGAIMQGIQGLAPSLTPIQADEALRLVLARLAAVNLESGTSFNANRYVSTAAALARLLTADQSRVVLTTLPQQFAERVLVFDSLIDTLVSRLPQGDMRPQFMSAIARMPRTLQQGAFAVLAQTARKIADRLSEEDARIVFPQWLESSTSDFGTPRIGRWAQAGTGLLPRLRANQLEALFASISDGGAKILDRDKRDRDSGDMYLSSFLSTLRHESLKKLSLDDLRDALHSLPATPRLHELREAFQLQLGAGGTDAETLAALKLLPDAAERVITADELEEFTAQIRAIAPKTSPEQALEVLRAILSTTNSFDEKQWSADAVVARTFVDRLQPAQAPAALKAFFGAIAEIPPKAAPTLRPPVEALLRLSTSAQRRSMLADAKTALSIDRERSDATNEWAEIAVGILAADLAPEQAEPMLDALLRVFKAGSADANLVEATQAVARRVPEASAERVFDRTFMKTTDDSDETIGFAVAAVSLSDRVSEARAQAAAKALFEAEGKAGYSPSLALFSGAVARRLTVDQASRMFGAILGAMRTMTDADAQGILNSAAEAVGERLDPPHAREQLQTVLTALSTRADTIAAIAPTSVARRASTEQSAGLFTAGRLLIRRISAPDEQAFAPLLLRGIAGSVLPGNEPRAAAAIEAVMSTWSDERKTRTLHSLLAWSATATEAGRWAARLKDLSLPQPAAAGVIEIVDMLKYPQSAGLASDQFLDLLKKVDDRAPGKEQGMGATLRWLASTYPGIDLDARPACPTPPSSALKCPVVRN